LLDLTGDCKLWTKEEWSGEHTYILLIVKVEHGAYIEHFLH
jgi:hypothetical protein